MDEEPPIRGYLFDRDAAPAQWLRAVRKRLGRRPHHYPEDVLVEEGFDPILMELEDRQREQERLHDLWVRARAGDALAWSLLDVAAHVTQLDDGASAELIDAARALLRQARRPPEKA